MTHNPKGKADDGQGHTPGPWPYEPSGDHKRIIIGKGLVEGPNGYDVAEVYSDDCPWDEAEANACLISAAPDLLEALAECRTLLGATFGPGHYLCVLCDAALAKATASTHAKAPPARTGDGTL